MPVSRVAIPLDEKTYPESEMTTVIRKYIKHLRLNSK